MGKKSKKKNKPKIYFIRNEMTIGRYLKLKELENSTLEIGWSPEEHKLRKENFALKKVQEIQGIAEEIILNLKN